MKKLVFLSLFVLTVATAMEYEPNSTRVLNGAPTYQKDIKPIFKARCSQCHNYMVGKNWQKYDDAYAERDKIKLKVGNKEMPMGQDMPEAERNLIIDWVNGGAPQ